MKHIITIFLFIVFVVNSTAQEKGTFLSDSLLFCKMSLEELMNVNITVTSQVPKTNREAQAILFWKPSPTP